MLIADDGVSIDCNIIVQHLIHTGYSRHGKGPSELQQPDFDIHKLMTQVTVTSGSPCLLGALNPTFGNGVTKNQNQKIWFSFLTATATKD